VFVVTVPFNNRKLLVQGCRAVGINRVLKLVVIGGPKGSVGSVCMFR
jgi:hypothetical protein